MGFRAQGTSVVRSAEDGDVGVAIAFDERTAARIADALNASSTDSGGRGFKDPLTGEQVDRIDVHDRRPLSEVVGKGTFVKIVGPYATAEMDTPGGRQIRALAAGSILPSDVTAGQARHLIDVGLAQLVEADSAREAYEGAPTERHRVEAAALTPSPTVGRPAEGSAAADYDRDPEAAARAAAAGPGPATTAQTTGAGQAFFGDDRLDDNEPANGEQGDRRGGRPSVRAPKEDWVAYAESQGTPREEAEGMSKAELVAKHGS